MMKRIRVHIIKLLDKLAGPKRKHSTKKVSAKWFPATRHQHWYE